MGKFAKKNQKELRLEAKKRSRPPRKTDSFKEIEADNDVVDTNSANFLHDEADQHYHKRQKILMDRGYQNDDDVSSDDENEILPVGTEDTSDEGSSEEDDAADVSEEEGIPSRIAWGSKRSTYYKTDFVDKDHGKFIGSDAEEAEEEEREARELQAKFAADLADEDFGIPAEQPVGGSLETVVPDLVPENTVYDVSKLSEFEQMERIKQESPELLDLIADGKRKLILLSEVLQPMVDKLASSKDKFLTERAELYVRTKHQLVLGYCENVIFYMSLKAKRASVENHPVTRRLVDFRKLLMKLGPMDRLYEDDLKRAVQTLSTGGDLKELCRKPVRDLHRKRSLKFGTDTTATGGQKDQPLGNGIRKKPLPVTKVKPKNADSDESEEDVAMGEDATEEGKRKVTYQMAKNKGIVPYRKKEYRNPRVKHRIKYRKALISRKGQVRDYRPELKKYGGELSGIRAGVVKSVKFK